ncbi:MAG: aminopeptidase P family protein [Paracoccus sp. (in: a-proteobacteria)]
MFQTFSNYGNPADHPPRLSALRTAMAEEKLDAFLIPRADAYQGEYVTDADARLRWLTGFSGSAGLGIVTADQAGIFVDGRYRVQIRSEVDLNSFTPVDYPETHPAGWLRKTLPKDSRVGFDLWLHTHKEITDLRKRLKPDRIDLVPVANLVDRVWTDKPQQPVGRVRLHDDAIAGTTAAEKCAQIARNLRRSGQTAAIMTLADSLSWLLNIRGSDLPRNPVVHGFAIINADATVRIFSDPEKFDENIRHKLGSSVSIEHPAGFSEALSGLTGPVRLDPDSAPEAIFQILADREIKVHAAEDPVIMPKATKNYAEIEGMRAAHLTDGAVMARFLYWLDEAAPGDLTEIDVVTRLETLRREAGILDISFDTICGIGPHAALPHYRVSTETNLPLTRGQVLLIDSGGQYPNGTTDITRTVAIGDASTEAREAFTRVLQGMIAMSRLNFPKGRSGRDIDAVARAPLWSAGQDYDHGTGHGVGAALCVHEGPARLSQMSEVPLASGMILSNEPGYYREGAFGIRIENLLIVTPANSNDRRDMLGFETLAFVPIDRRMIVADMLSPTERDWLNTYHTEVFDKIAPLLDPATQGWLQGATAPI